jgi:hypothetical protein
MPDGSCGQNQLPKSHVELDSPAHEKFNWGLVTPRRLTDQKINGSPSAHKHERPVRWADGDASRPSNRHADPNDCSPDFPGGSGLHVS